MTRHITKYNQIFSPLIHLSQVDSNRSKSINKSIYLFINVYLDLLSRYFDFKISNRVNFILELVSEIIERFNLWIMVSVLILYVIQWPDQPIFRFTLLERTIINLLLWKHHCSVLSKPCQILDLIMNVWSHEQCSFDRFPVDGKN